MAKLVSMLVLSVTVASLIFIPMTEGSRCKKRKYLPADKPQVVFVHGFRSGGYACFRERYILETAGYNVTAIDLRASGVDMTDISEINTFEDYNQPLDQFMAQLPAREKVVLVGGSAGGMSVTKVLHDHPEKVLVALYISATMIKDGYLTCADLEMLYTLSKSLNRPGPLRAIVTANFTDASRKSSSIDRVPRVYVKTLLDKVLLPWQQDAMINQWPPCEVIEVEYGHGVGNEQLVAAFIVNATMYM